MQTLPLWSLDTVVDAAPAGTDVPTASRIVAAAPNSPPVSPLSPVMPCLPTRASWGKELRQSPDQAEPNLTSHEQSRSCICNLIKDLRDTYPERSGPTPTRPLTPDMPPSPSRGRIWGMSSTPPQATGKSDAGASGAPGPCGCADWFGEPPVPWSAAHRN